MSSRELKIDKEDKILVLSPHPDDESIGCGGFLLKYAAQCDVILLTDGAKTNKKWEEDIKRKTRAREFRKAMEYLGVHQYKMMRIPDSRLSKYLYRLDIIPYEKYTYVLVPNPYEAHWDHSVIFPKVERIIRKRHLKTKIIQYEVWTPILRPTHYIDLTDLIIEKQKLIQLYKLALTNIDYDKRITALAYYRAIIYECQYAECYRMSEYDLSSVQRLKKIRWQIESIKNYVKWLIEEN